MTDRLHLAIALLASALLAAACAGSAHSPNADGPEPRDGRFTFTERPSGTTLTFEGSFVVLHDTVMVEADPGPCWYDTSSSPVGPIVYHCSDVTLSFDRDDPVHKARYAYTSVEQKPKSVCLRYTTTASGRQVCAQTGTEIVEVKTPHTGLLRPQRVESAVPTP